MCGSIHQLQPRSQGSQHFLDTDNWWGIYRHASLDSQSDSGTALSGHQVIQAC